MAFLCIFLIEEIKNRRFLSSIYDMCLVSVNVIKEIEEGADDDYFPSTSKQQTWPPQSSKNFSIKICRMNNASLI